MSWVTNTILHFGSLGRDYERRPLEQVNVFITEHVGPEARGFVSVEDESLPCGWYGGGKNLECSLAIGAFNGLDINGLIEHLCNLCAANALDPVATQLILRDQEEEKFRVISIDEEMQARGMRVPWLEPDHR